MIFGRLPLFFVCLFSVWATVCLAGHESYTGTSGTHLATSDTFSVTDPKYFSDMCPGGTPTSPLFVNHKVVDRVSLDLNYLSKAYTSTPFTVTAVIQVLYNIAGTCPASGSRIPPGGQNFTITLKISYDPRTGKKDIDESSYVFKNAHHFIVKILSISTTLTTGLLDEMVRIDGFVDIDRYYQYTKTTVPTFATETNINAHEKTVHWNALTGAEGYELEWRWYDINKGHLLDSRVYFKDSSTRVNIVAENGSALPTGYTIPLIYEEGYLVCRVRAIYISLKDFTTRIPGAWSRNDNSTPLDSVGLPTPSTHDIFYISGFEHTLNWQYTGSFTDDGKKKTLVNFYDGSLRSRQMITKNYTTQKIIVGEEIYDHVGRKAVSVLPVPDTGSTFAYHNNFNLNVADSLYSWKDFEIASMGDSCSIAAGAMATISGASKYYSSNNGFTDYHKYLADAGGYPFAQTEYMPDNSGRVRRQSGVGPTHKLNSSHETKYYYGVPRQDELDRIFGSDVGFASRYKKNMVIDANGQVSISYMDAHGRVIATALAGDGAPNMQKLDSNTGAVLDTGMSLVDSAAMLGPNPNAIENVSVLNYPLLVEKSGDVTFNYQFKPEKYQEACIHPTSICYDCVYDLNIIVTDECNQVVSQTTRTVGHLPADTICGNNLDTIKAVWTVSLNVGNYTVHKSLTVNESAMDYYTDKYIKEDTCLKTYASFYSEQLSHIDFSGCNKTCATCNVYNNCDPMYQAMLGDVSPGGQYGEFYRNGPLGIVVRDSFPLSVFNLYNKLPDDSANWQHPHTPYVNEAGVADSVMIDGVNYPPQNLPDMFTFVENWKSSWSKSLVYYHPEYPYYQWCQLNRTTGSDSYDSTMLAISSYNSAKSSGYFNPLSMTSGQVNPSGYAAHTVADPFFTHAPGDSLKNYMKSRMRYFVRSSSNTVYSMWQIAIASAKCGNVLLEQPKDGLDDNTLQSCLSGFTDTATSCVNDSIWKKFSMLYLSEKNKIKNRLADQYALNHFGYNGCIGNSTDQNFSMLDSNFDEIVVSQNPIETSPRQPCSEWTRAYYANKEKRFEPNINAFGKNLQHVTNDDISDMVTTAKDSMRTNCTSRCRSYIPLWKAELAGCGMDSTTTAKLMDTMVNICSAGCDADNPFGSSTTPPHIKGGYQTFEAAIKGMSGHSSFDTACNVLQISMPEPYNHTFAVHQDARPVGCSIGATPQATKTCIECSMLRTAKLRFDTSYPSAVISTSYHTLLTNYLNNYLNVNYLFIDYDSLLSLCDSLEPAPSGCSLVGDTSIDVQNFLNLVFNDTAHLFHTRPYVLATRLDTTNLSLHALFKDFKHCKPELYIKPEPYLGAYFEMDMLGLCGTNYFIKLRLPDIGYDPKYLSHFVNFRAYPVSGGDNYMFLIDARYKRNTGRVDGMGHIVFDSFMVTLTGSSTWKTTTCASTAVTSFICGPDATPLPNVKDEFHYAWEGIVAFYCQPIPISNCGCDKVFDAMKFFNSNRTAFDATGTSFASYFESLYPDFLCSPNVPKFSVDSLFHMCLKIQGKDSLHFNPAAATLYSMAAQARQDSMAAAGLKMPAVMACKYDPTSASYTCASCNDISYEIKNAVGTISKDSLTQNSTHDSAYLYRYYQRVSGILSNKFNKNLTAMAKPDSANCPTCTGGMYVCDEVSPEMMQMDTLLRELAKNNKLATTENITTYKSLNYRLKPADSLSCTYYSYTGSTSPDSETLTISLVSDCGDFNCTMMMKANKKISDWNAVDSFKNMRVARGARGPSYYFNVDAVLGDGSTVTFTGQNTCHYVTQCCAFTAICPSVRPGTLTIDTSQCRKQLYLTAQANAWTVYSRYVDSARRAFRLKYARKCMTAHERFVMNQYSYKYHYTLYYYDQGGSLVKTVPPKGVNVLSKAQTALVFHRRIWGGTRIVPSHALATTYKYNGLNEQVWTQSPDADSSQSWYDNLGRIVVSQSGRQRPLALYSYTIFDKLGRITEVGETHSTTPMVDSIGLNATYLKNWTNAGTRKQITRTFYDSVAKSYVSAKFGHNGQQNLRTRVSTMAYYENNSDSGWAHATHYSYDEHGNVNTLLQDYPEWTVYNMRYKRIDYGYDLISGKVNTVDYQAGRNDQWHHRYEYDADERLTEVYTSIDSVLWDKDADYKYYQHGPMARTKLGRLNVQGMDYAYTIQGWMKSMNSDYLSPVHEIGRDGDQTLAGGTNRWVARDAVGYSLGYFKDDYTPVNATHLDVDINWSGGSKSGLIDTTYRKDLYNGNIAHMVTAIGVFMSDKKPLGSVYKYDQLNRLAKATYYNNVDTGSTDAWGIGTGGMGKYQQTLTYDANGNILTQVRDGDGTGGHTQMDQLTYNYTSNTNRLDHVDDAISSAYYTDDLDDQSSGNYTYDGSGNLIHDLTGEIDTIKWSAYGKVRDVVRTGGSLKPGMHFDYGPDGQRWVKTVKKGTNAKDWTYSWYVRDAQGNVMAVYNRAIKTDPMDNTHLKDSIALGEQDMYGSSRLGMVKRDTMLIKLDYKGSVSNTTTMPVITTLNSTTVLTFDTIYYKRVTGRKRFELNNHLGNVLATISDRHLRVQHPSHTDSTIYFTADVITATDYYAFGAPMPGRKFNIDSTVTVPKDTCVTCGQLKTALLSYRASMLDTAKIRAHMDSSFAAFHQSGASWLTELRTCKLLKEYVNFPNFHYNYFDFGYHGQFHFGAGDATMEAWVRIPDSTGFKTVMSTIVGTGLPSQFSNGLTLRMNKSRPEVQVVDNSATVQIDALNGISLNTWHHIVGVRVGNTTTNWKIYVDGSLVSSFKLGTGTLVSGNTDTLVNGGLTLGGAGTNNPFGGDIRDARAYKRAITGTEVSASYNSGCGGVVSDTTKLSLRVLLNESTGYYSHDISNYALTSASYTGWSGVAPTWKREIDSSCYVGNSVKVICKTIYTANASSYRYGFNGMEKDNEVYGDGDAYTAEFWEYDPRLGRRWNLDPVNQPHQSPYAGLNDNPIFDADPLGDLAGDYYDKGGKHIGDDGIKDNKAYLSDQKTIDDNTKDSKTDWNKVKGASVDLTATTGLTNSQIIDRAHWIFGEGRGEFADAYAHAIANLKEWGAWGHGSYTEDEIYEKNMNGGGESGKAEHFSGHSSDGNYNKFTTARKNLDDLNDLPGASTSIAAVIGQLTGKTVDPTNGAKQWLGYSIENAMISYKYEIKKFGADHVLLLVGKTRGHLFINNRNEADTKRWQKMQAMKNKISVTPYNPDNCTTGGKR